MILSDYSRRVEDNLFRWLSRGDLPPVSANAANGTAAVATAVGNTRTENQDCGVIVRYSSYRWDASFSAYILCDGIGGMKDGGICSRKAIATLIATMLQPNELPTTRARNAIVHANESIYREYRENGGTTMSCVFAPDAHPPTAFNVGDSRIYAVTAKTVEQLTTDDNIASEMQKLKFQPEDVAFGKQLTQYIGIGSDLRVLDISLEGLDANGFLLTTDGVHCVQKRVFDEIVLNAPTPLDVVKRISAVSRWGRALDNGSALFVSARDSATLARTVGPEMVTIWDSFGRVEILLDAAQLVPRRPYEQRYPERRKANRRRGKSAAPSGSTTPHAAAGDKKKSEADPAVTKNQSLITEEVVGPESAPATTSSTSVKKPEPLSFEFEAGEQK